MATQRALRIGSAAIVALCLASPLRAQSLADVAKKEEDRRKTTAEPAKVYTNKDLKKAEASLPVADPAKPADTAKDAKAKDAKDKDDKDQDASKDGGKDKDAKDKAAPKDQAYWSGRLKALEDKLLRDTNYLDAMTTRINALNTDFVNRDDPVQRGVVERDRQKAIVEQNRLKQDIVDDKKAIADLHEEARQAGIPPAWLR
jgi:hypothetical protein